MGSSAPKTVPTKASVKAFIAAVDDPARRADCQALVKMMEKATGEKAVMWGEAIVGFGTYRYQYASGTTGDWPVVAFSPRKNDLTVYLMPGFEAQATLLARLGKHKTGKVCLYLKRLADIDLAVLQALIDQSVAAMAPTRITKDKTT
jgi:Domain of unknown function (DU1801)